MSESKNIETSMDEQAAGTDATASTSASKKRDDQKGGGSVRAGDSGQGGGGGKGAFNTPLGAPKAED